MRGCEIVCDPAEPSKTSRCYRSGSGRIKSAAVMPEVQGQELYAASPAASMGHVWADIPDDCDGTAELAVNADLLFDRNFGGCEKLHSVEGHIHACSSQ